ncbi:amylopectin binding protein [Aureococcus anophagefferens]|nr:amylopectin binding protein [Aureococcus anophagefferens]
MAAWVNKIPAPREAIIHAISFGPDNLFVVGDDEALTVYAAADNGVVRRWDDLSTVLSAALLRLEDGAVVAAGGTMRGEIHLRSIAGDAAGRAARVAAAPRPLSAAVEAVALRGRRLALALSVLGSHDGPLVSCYELPEDESPFEIDPEDSDGDDGDLGDALAINYAGEPADPFAPVLVAKLDARADPRRVSEDGTAAFVDGRAPAPLAPARWRDRRGAVRDADAASLPAGARGWRRRARRRQRVDVPAVYALCVAHDLPDLLEDCGIADDDDLGAPAPFAAGAAPVVDVSSGETELFTLAQA